MSIDMTLAEGERELAFCIRYCRGDVFREWLATVFSVLGYAHGSDLVMALGSPRGDRPGLADNVYTADKFLRAALAAGWIVRDDEPSPTPQQQFFDVEGNLNRKNKGPKCPRYYGYRANPWAVAAMDFIRAGMSPPASVSPARAA